jgi:hypothetical protein
LNITGGHATGIQRQYFVIKPVKTGLSFLDDDWFKFSVSVTGNGYLCFAKFSFDRLFTMTIAAILGVTWLCFLFFFL